MYRNMTGAFICALLVVTLYSSQMEAIYAEDSLVLQLCLLAYVFSLICGTTRGNDGNE